MRQPAQQLGVIRPPELLVGRRPRPVVDEIAVRIEPDVERQHADHDTLFVAGLQMAGHPTPLASRRAVPFEDLQKIGVEEGMARRTEASPYVARDGFGGMAGVMVRSDIGQAEYCGSAICAASRGPRRNV